MSIQEFVEKISVEFLGIDFRSSLSPPARLRLAVMKSDVTELTRIGENQSSVLLIQNEVIMFAGLEIFAFNVRPPGHSKVKAEPAPNVFASPDHFGVIARKAKCHLLSTPFRSD